MPQQVTKQAHSAAKPRSKKPEATNQIALAALAAYALLTTAMLLLRKK